MKFRRLGSSGLLVSELALGTMIFGEQSARSVPEDDAVRMVHHFLDAGGNHIDTADVYSGGRSEEIVGKALRGHRDQVILATKVRFRTGPGPNDVGLSRAHIRQGVEASLRHMATDRIDLLYMHGWDAHTPLEESLRALDDMIRAGKVHHIGISNFRAWSVMKALALSELNGWARCVSAQYQYSLVVRDIEQEFIDLCISENIALVPWGPLGGGFLTGKYHRDERPVTAEAGRLATTPADSEESWEHRATEQNWETLAVMDDIATQYSATHSQIALAWLLKKPAVTSVILGARTMSQLEDNLGAAELELPEEEILRLDAVSAPPDTYPYRMIDNFE